MKVLALGAGVVGVTSAWYLSKAGHEVTVVDRHAAAGMETSFANGGQISEIVTLGLYSRASLQALRAETGLQYDQLSRGILYFYTSARELDAAIEPARVMRNHGGDVEMVSREQCLEIEPALRNANIVGGSWTPSDESGDAHKFTQGLAALAADRGVKFRAARVLALAAEGGRVAGVRVERPDLTAEVLEADAYVVCLGSYSPLFMRPLGIPLNIYPAKGPAAHRGYRRAERLQHGVERGALPRDPAARARPLPRWRRSGAGPVLGGAAAGDAVECSVHRRHALSESLPQQRARHARLDALVRQRTRARRHRERPQARDRLRLYRPRPRAGHGHTGSRRIAHPV